MKTLSYNKALEELAKAKTKDDFIDILKKIDISSIRTFKIKVGVVLINNLKNNFSLVILRCVVG